MVGSRGKGTRSKTKGLAPGPIEREPLKISFDESSDGPLDGEDGMFDTLNPIMMSLEEDQINEMVSGFVVSDGNEEKDQNAHEVNNMERDQNAREVNNMEKDVVTEINVGRTEDVCTQGTIEDVNEVIDGNHAAADVSVEVLVDNEENRKKPEENEARKIDKKPEEDESPVNFGLDNNDSCTGDERKSSEVTPEAVPTNNEGLASSDHGIEENMIDNMEILKELCKLDTEKPIGTLSEKGEDEHIEENESIANEVKEVTGKVNRPKRKLGKKKVIKKKIIVRKPEADEARKYDNKPGENEGPVKFGLDNNYTGIEDEMKSSEVTTEAVLTNNESLASSDHGIKEDMKDDLGNHKESSKHDLEEPIGTLSDRGQDQTIENASITDEVKEATARVNGPKRKVVKKKVVKKKMVQRNAAAVNEKLPQPTDEDNASGEACKVDTNEHVNNDGPSNETCKAYTNVHVNNSEGTEVKPPVKVNRKQSNLRKKKAPQGDSDVLNTKDAHKPQSGYIEPRVEEHIDINELNVKNGEVEKPEERVSPSKRSKKKNVTKKGSQEGASNDLNQSKSSKDGKSSKRIDSMGMIFMCSSETKKDCYRYKILGLPAGKKDMVMKIYKGMRLFLFDIDLRMMYGVYKAADPGGYNIEPRAFKSQFPSQVRFSILEDCVPLAEERFKQVLKDNYYTKNKFNCQLNSKQVKNLCKLFHESSKKAESKKVSVSQRPATTNSSARRDKKRKRVDDSHRGAAAPIEGERSRRRAWEEIRRAPMIIDDRSRRRAREEIIRHAPVIIDDRSWRRGPEEIRHAPVVIDDRSRRSAQEEIRHAPVVIDDRYNRHPVYERETYLSTLSSVAPATSYQPLPAHSPPRTRMYSFDRTLEVDPYRRDSVLDHRDLGLSSSQESRLPIGRSHHDPNVSYREPCVYNMPVYSTDTRTHYDYTSDRQYTEYYRPAEHRPPPPLYRRY